MAGWAGLGVKGIAGYAGVATVVVAAVVGGYVFFVAPSQREPEPVAAVTPAPAPAPAPAPDQPAAAVEPASPSAPVAVPAPAAPSYRVPSFDSVRVESDGMAIVAGRSEPGLLVEVLLDQEVIARERADARGQFTSIFTVPPAAAPRVVSLSTEAPDGTRLRSENTVIILGTAPEEIPQAEPAPVAPPEVAAASPAPEIETALAAPREGVAPREDVAGAPRSPAADGPEPPPADATPPRAAAVEPAPAQEAAPGTEASTSPGTDDAPAQIAAVAPPPAGGTLAPTAPSSLAREGPEPPPTESVVTARPAEDTGPRDDGPPEADVSADAGAVEGASVAAELPIASAEPEARLPAEDEERASVPPEAAPEAAAPPAAAALASAPAPQPAPRPAVVIAGSDGLRVLQSADDAPGGAVSIGAISYDAAGEVVISGRATAGRAVRLYVDNRPVALAPVAANGTWETGLTEVAAGIYTLRADELGDDGRVRSRIETPFRKESPDAVRRIVAAPDPVTLPGASAAAPDTLPPPRVATVTVQPGFTL